MFKKTSNFFKKNWLILVILTLGLFLRGYRYAEFPIAGETEDEIAWVMLGSSLIQEGEPTSWSYFGSYKNFIYKNNGEGKAPWVRPTVDHPPLFSLIPGFFHSLKNSWDQAPSMKLVRFPMILIGTFNIWLLYLVAQKIFKEKKIVYLATVIYTVVPTFVLSSRLVVAENLLVSWMLLTIYLIKSKLKYKNLFLILVSIAAILTKVSGLVIPLGIIFYGWQKRKERILETGLVGLFLGELVYFIYGALLNLQLFLEINLLAQANREIGLSTIVNRLFLNPAVVEKAFFDGWLILGLLAAVAWFLVEPKKYLIIKIYTILWLAFIAATAGEQTFHAWYDYPFYPLLALAVAWFIHYLVTKKMYWLVWLSWLLVLPTVRLALVFSNQYHEVSNLVMRGIMGLGAVPLGFSLIKRDKVNGVAREGALGYKLAQKSILFLGLLLIGAAIAVTLFINDRSYWEMDQFYRMS